MKMEPNKLENHIKEQLNLRTIQPSAQAWDRLDSMLTVANNTNIVAEKKSKKKFAWLFIAASIVGFVFIGSLFYNQNNTVENQIVINPKVESQKQETEEIENRIFEKSKTESRKPENENLVINKPKAEKTVNPIVIELPRIIKQDEILVNNENKEPEDLNNNTNISDNINLTKNEASIATEPANNNKQLATISVDAASLLSQVDGELTLSFREKIIKKYQTVKVALADRNNQKQ